MTTDQLKSYHSEKTNSLCPGHPEIEHDGIEVTTGPLGQGVANSVGLAMATKQLASIYNRPGYDVVDNMTWCMIGDACLQEGIGMEAVSLAGHWKLNNLCIIYDNNQITCDGTVDVACSEDVNAKMRAYGWNVLEIYDGDSNIAGIVTALVHARISNKPTFINIRTVIGFGSKVAGNAKAHGAALGAPDVANIKRSFNLDPKENFVIPDTVYDFFKDVAVRGEELELKWNTLIQGYSKDYPELSHEFKLRASGKMVDDWTKFIPSKEELPTAPTSSRKSAGIVCNKLAANLNTLLVGTADLTPSVFMDWKDKVDFQSVRFHLKMQSLLIANIKNSPNSALRANRMETTPVGLYTTESVSMQWQVSPMD